MRKSLHQFKLGLLGATLALLTFGGSAAFALPSQVRVHAASNTPTTSTGKPANPGAQAGTHLAEARLKVCQNREKTINRIISKIVTRGNNQLALFDTIAGRVEAFKTSKDLTVSNYDQLVTKLQADKSAATTDLTAMKANSTLDCTSSDPKGMAEAFKADLKTEISDLQTYRTDIKNLIVAVKTAIGSSNSTNSTSSPSTKANSNATTGGTQ